MALRTSISFLALLTMLSVYAVHIGGTLHSEGLNLNPHVFCGRNLAKILAVVCFDQTYVKRSGISGTMYNDIVAPYYKERDQDTQLEWPWLSPYKMRALQPSRAKRFVVTECCDKPCTVNELLSYC